MGKKVRRYLLLREGVYFSVVFLFDEAIIFQTSDKRQAVVYLTSELGKAVKVLTDAGIEYDLLPVNKNMMPALLDMEL